MNKKVEKAINDQINAELYSAYLYLSMAAYAESEGLPGFGNWMKRQANEEVAHAMKFFDYVAERGGRVTLAAIDQPDVEFEGPQDLFEKTLQHEQLVTSLIHDLYALTVEEKDYASQILLQWYIEEQVEEESSANEILDQIRMAGAKGHVLLMLDRALGSRVAD